MTCYIKHEAVFANELGILDGPKVKLHVDPEVMPKFLKVRPLTYSLKPLVEEELKKQVNNGIIAPVQFSISAAPIAPVMKKMAV